MENFERFLGKKVLITVAFGAGLTSAGSIPEKFIGVLEKAAGDFLEFSTVEIERRNFTSVSYAQYSNYATINKQYVIMMAEV